jgi:hypothetical protein
MQMPEERSRPNWFTRACLWLETPARAAAQTVAGQVADPKARKHEAIAYWDREAKQLIKQDKLGRAFAAWTTKQLAKAHAESKFGLAMDVLSFGSGKLLVKGIQKGARVVQGVKTIRTGHTTVVKVLESVSKAAKTIEEIAPKYIQPVTVRGREIVTPRRAVKALSKIGKGVSTHLGGKLVSGKRDPISVSVPEVITRSRHQQPSVVVKPLIDSIAKKPIRSVLDVKPKTALKAPQLITRSQTTVTSQSLPIRLRPVTSAPGSLQWMAQELDRPARGLSSPLAGRSRPLAPHLGSLQWIAQGLSRR